jgi:hypothetical protein
VPLLPKLFMPSARGALPGQEERGRGSAEPRAVVRDPSVDFVELA